MKGILTVLCTIVVLALQAQNYELRVVERGQQAHVQLRNVKEVNMRTSESEVTDIVFGLKWRDTGITGFKIASNEYKMVKSDGVREHNGYQFQAFGAMSTPYPIPVNWESGKWVDILVVNIEGTASAQTKPGSGYRARLALTEMGFDITTDPNIGINLIDETPAIVPYNITDVTTTPGPTMDKIELQVAKYGPQNSHLSWGIENPDGFRAFIVERKIGESEWAQLAELPAAGQFVHMYVDENVYDGVKQKQVVSYRIRGIADTEISSEEKNLDFTSQKMFVEVYPNPASDKVQVTMTPTETDGETFLEIYSTDGKLAFRNPILSASVKEIIDLAAANLESGSYTVHLVVKDEILDVRPLHVMR